MNQSKSVQIRFQFIQGIAFQGIAFQRVDSKKVNKE